MNFRWKFEFPFFVYVLRKQGMDLKMGQARRVQAKTQNFASTRISGCHVIQPPDPPASYANKDEKGLNRVLVSEKWKIFLLFQDRIRKVGRTNANVVENRKYKCMQNFVATFAALSIHHCATLYRKSIEQRYAFFKLLCYIWLSDSIAFPISDITTLFDRKLQVFENSPKRTISGNFHQFLSYLKMSCIVTLFDRKIQAFKNSSKYHFWHF